MSIHTIGQPEALAGEPQAFATELTILNQIRQDEMTIIWGLDDALPLHIQTAIAESPTTSACIGKLETYTKGSGFSDEGLQNMVINKDGDTLGDLHNALVPYFVQLDGFSLNFKYNNGGKINNVYVLPTEGCRFKTTAESKDVTAIKYNPYFGTRDYQLRFTTEYPLFDLSTVKDQNARMGIDYPGQAYFFGTKRTLYKHYPVPKFWSGNKWIYSDAKMAIYIDKLLSNGFFQSVLMKVIGDPNAMSRHPESMKEVLGTDNVKRKEPTLTNAQVFDKMMAANFAGVNKAATAMVLWSLNPDDAVTLESFPTTVNFDTINGTLLNTIRMISLATEVPAILANLPDTQSPLSGQDALPHAIEFVQANTAPKRAQLEKFYNTILLPNLENSTKARVSIKQYSSVKAAITVDQNIWNVLSTKEKRQFIKDNTEYPIIYDDPTVINPVADHLRDPIVTDPIIINPTTINPQPDPSAPVDPNAPAPDQPTSPQVDENLKNMKVSEINRISSIVRKYEKGQLTLDQAKQLLSGYGLNEEQQTAWLNPSI